jgi:hypothetical protein
MNPNLLEDDTMERLQSGADSEILVWEYIATAKHALEKKKLFWINRKQKKPL